MNEAIYMDIVRKDNALEFEIRVRVQRTEGALEATVTQSIPDPQARRDRHEWLWERGELITLTESERAKAYGLMRIRKEQLSSK